MKRAKKLDIKALNKVTDVLTRKKQRLYQGGLTQYNQPQQEGASSKAIEDAAGSVPLWGGIFNTTRDMTDMIKGDGTDPTTSAVASAFSPSSGVTTAMDYGDTEDVLLAAFNPIGGGINNASLMEKAEAERKNAINAGVKADAMSFKEGGKMANLEKPIAGGDLKPVSSTGVEVKANDPSKTDSVELPTAFVDDGEIIDKGRVYSDSLKLPTGRTIAKEAKRLEKMKGSSRFEAANKHIDSKLDSLFKYQEAMKEPKGNRMFDSQNTPNLKKGGKLRLAFGGPDTELESGVTKSELDILSQKGNPFVNHPFTLENSETDYSTDAMIDRAVPKQQQASKPGGTDWQGIATTAATVAPNITNAFLQGKLRGPAAPQLETKNKLKRFTPDATLASQNRLFNQAQTAIQRGTAQSSDLISGTGSLLAKRLAAQNETYGAINNLNANIANQEAQLNTSIGARNTERVNIYNQGVSDFINKKLQLTSENVANLSQKALARGRERNEMEKDRQAMELIQAAYGDSGVLARLEAKNPELYDSVRKSLGLKKGGMIPVKLNKKKSC